MNFLIEITHSKDTHQCRYKSYQRVSIQRPTPRSTQIK